MYIHQINPVALDLGFFQIHWYALMYLLGFAIFILLGKTRIHKIGWNSQQLLDLLTWCVLGILIGGRLGYVLFYSPERLLTDPIFLVQIWKGGMSFHGAAIGIIIASYFYGRSQQKNLFDILDFALPLGAPGLGLGRLGNFIGGELWGRPSDVPWAMVFPNSGNMLARHPSQLYQAFLEGVVLFLVLWFYSKATRARMKVSALGLGGYALFRIIAENFREPDRQLGFLAWDWLTMGQLLSFCMLGIALILWYLATKNPVYSLKK